MIRQIFFENLGTLFFVGGAIVLGIWFGWNHGIVGEKCLSKKTKESDINA